MDTFIFILNFVYSFPLAMMCLQNIILSKESNVETDCYEVASFINYLISLTHLYIRSVLTVYKSVHCGNR